jgi:rhodanese-related sulfurtransferase
MAVQRISPAEAAALIEHEGYVYLDVRSVPEFESGHPTGAYNIPLLHMSGFGLTPNASFLPECERAFPKDARIVVGCRSGGRSLQAATLLLAAGYAHVVDQRCGFEGAGEPGWRHAGLPVAQEAHPERTHAALTGARP